MREPGSSGAGIVPQSRLTGGQGTGLLCPGVSHWLLARHGDEGKVWLPSGLGTSHLAKAEAPETRAAVSSQC